LGLPEWGLADAVFNNPVSREASLGRATAEDIWRWVGERFRLSPEDLARLRADFFRGDRLDEELLGLIRALRRRMPVGMITNAWPEMLHWLEEKWKMTSSRTSPPPRTWACKPTISRRPRGSFFSYGHCSTRAMDPPVERPSTLWRPPPPILPFFPLDGKI
jgi:hypothetical protein